MGQVQVQYTTVHTDGGPSGTTQDCTAPGARPGSQGKAEKVSRCPWLQGALRAQSPCSLLDEAAALLVSSSQD